MSCHIRVIVFPMIFKPLQNLLPIKTHFTKLGSFSIDSQKIKVFLSLLIFSKNFSIILRFFEISQDSGFKPTELEKVRRYLLRRGFHDCCLLRGSLPLIVA